MTMLLSELYGRRMLTTSGKMLGDVKSIILNMDEGEISHLMLDKMDMLIRSNALREDFFKNSISYKRVKKVGDTIVVGLEPPKK